ncbi:cyclin-dependent kinase 4 inhibitor C-like [Branchiostoma floridae]|uniref:Cyclin-dependent kinase 4 inhibitor C-like n=1 Tax=Branchiostoma floridae TaxID=7739 RepID=A0A9J7MCZ2_BRAFL|nr:cyclin-dependent kinase 4 inhibitor C-like [Branchiostoma floridae]XP_035698982.1 cyclin-dependent kinase 4 inhibitor C-like [Branchiostoma floridae]
MAHNGAAREDGTSFPEGAAGGQAAQEQAAGFHAINVHDGNDLTTAAARGDLEEVRRLLAAGVDVNARNQHGMTAIQVMEFGHHIIAKELLENGADPNVRDVETGLSPVHDAARDGWEDTLKLLFEYHADLDVKDLQDMTPAHLAAEKGHVRILEFLRAKSTDLWAKNRRGQTPRDLARIHGKTDVTAWFRGSFPEQHAEQQGQ